MKGRIILLMAIAILVSGLSAKAQQVTVNLRQVRLEKILDAVSKQAGVNFYYSEPTVNPGAISTLQVRKATLSEALNVLFKDSSVTFDIQGSKVYLASRQSSSAVKERTIRGTVFDAAGVPVIGAAIVNVRTGKGMVSDVTGAFSMEGVIDNDILEVSCIGYKPARVSASTKSVLNIVLAEDSEMLEEAVTIGYGSMREGLITNAISKFKPAESDMRHVLSPAELLQGRVAGVNITTASGNLAASEKVSIRGSSSLSASNEPLYVIDGIPLANNSGSLYNFGEETSTLATLNLSDIESIEVLKDAASAAIYGSRATNGVVLITTRHGREGQSDLKLSYSVSMTSWANRNRRDYCDVNTWMQIYNEGVDNYNAQNGSNTATYISNPFEGLPAVDWLGLVTQTGISHNVDVSMGGGSRKVQYYINGNYAHQEGVIKTNSVEKINLRSNIGYHMFDWLKVGANVSGNYLRNNRIPGTGLGSSIIARTVEQRPIDRPFKPDGSYYVGGTDELVYHNPVQILSEETTYSDNARFIGSVFAEIYPLKGMKLNVSLNNDTGYTYDYIYYNQNHPYAADNGRIIDKTRFNMTNTVDVYASYDKTFANGAGFGVMAGHSFLKYSEYNSSIDAQNYPSPAFDMVTSAAVIAGASANRSGYAIESYFARGNFSYKDRYILNATIRTDGSSRFAPKHRWGWFPSVSLGWNMAKEEWWNSDKTTAKIRASYGATGNQDGISNYGWQALIAGGQNYDSASGIAISSSGNENLTWETAYQYNIGIDASFFGGKFGVIADAYVKNTDNLLFSKPVHATTGETSILSNIGSMENRGVELTLDAHLNIGPVQWNSSFNIYRNTNKLTSLLGDEILAIGSNRILQVGKPIGSWWLFDAAGIYQYDGEVPDLLFEQNVRAGDVKYVDHTGDGNITDDDRIVIGNPNPDFAGGWNNSFGWKGIDLSIFFTYSYGNDVYASWMTAATRTGNRPGLLRAWAENRWTGPGSTNKYPRAVYSYNSWNNKNCTNYLMDGSFIRLRSVTLSYTFPAKVLSKMHMKGLRLYAQGDNLLLFSSYPGWDPESSVSQDPRFYGEDAEIVPQPRTVKLGINVTF